MDMIDILGGILGQKASKPGKGSDVLKDIFGRGQQPASRGASIPTADQISNASRELEEMLNVANDRYTGGSGHRGNQSTQSTPRSAPTSRHPSHETSPSSTRADSRFGQPKSVPSGAPTESGDRALVLVRAMVNAAKADGQIDQAEQQNILQRLSDRSPETIEFLRQEFSRPLDVHQFAKSVPLGMEEQVYMLSLITIDLDTSGEAKYLTELGDSLRISPEVRNQIHARVGAPSLY